MFENFENAKVLCIGESMLDKYVYGTVTRYSPEAPIPLMNVTREDMRLGGAANTANNIAALGARCTLITMTGKCSISHKLTKMIGAVKNIEPFMLAIEGRGILKNRYVCEKKGAEHQLLRVDYEDRTAITPAQEKMIVGIFDQQVEHHDIVVISDYDKGMLTDHLLKYLIHTAHQYKKPVIVDPKCRNIHCYADADYITPNVKEYLHLAGVVNVSSFVDVARRMLRRARIGTIVLTRSEKGISLIGKTFDRHFKTQVEAIDVCGAGDTVVATLAVSLAANLHIMHATQLANMAAGIVVKKPGTATVTIDELKEEYEKSFY